jgi:hypothetical protein
MLHKMQVGSTMMAVLRDRQLGGGMLGQMMTVAGLELQEGGGVI